MTNRRLWPMKKLLLIWVSLAGFAWCAMAGTTISPANHYGCGANLGWMDWRGDVANGAVIGEYVCSGFIYAANAGWIDLGDGTPVNGIRYQNNAANDYGVNRDPLGSLRGFAYGANIGWINFEPLGAPKVDLRTGQMSGYAWSANTGWIGLSNAFASVQTQFLSPGADSDGDGIADAWELLKFGNLTAATAISNADGDGMSDKQEYQADTDPLDPADNLRVTAFTTGVWGTPASISWTAKETRAYYVLKTTNLWEPVAWADSGLGLIWPDDSITTRVLADPSVPEKFLRIQLFRPLTP
jgi:hypothetical protein